MTYPMDRQTPVEKAVHDRDRLYRQYKAAKKQELAELYADPEWGDVLRKFVATLKHFGPEHADRMVEYVSTHKLTQAPLDIRFAALQQCDYRITRIRQRAGLVPFDDPLPGEEPTVFTLCKRALGL